jgi:hypothetical protein
MRTHVIAPLLTLTLLLTIPPAALAQTNNSGQTATNANAQDWQGLSTLKTGKKVLVEFKTGGTVDGKFVSVVGSILTLSSDGNTYTLEQRDIHRVYSLKGRWSRSKAARVGAGIGMLVGTFVGVGRMVRAESEPGFTPSGHADTAPAFAGFGIGTLAGAGAGALLGGKRKGKLLYEAR